MLPRIQYINKAVQYIYENSGAWGVVWTKKKKKYYKGKLALLYTERGVGMGGWTNGKTLPCIDGCVIDGATTFDKSVHYV